MPVSSKQILTLVAILALATAAWLFLTMPDNRTTSQRVGDAIHDMDARQLEDRTPGQKAGDAIKDAGDKVKNSTSSSSGPSN